jgi:hypothetical protein
VTNRSGKENLVRGIRIAVTMACLAGVLGCASVPPQVAQIHMKEREILDSLQKSHLAMVDAFVDERIQRFETVFFKDYGPAYLNNWRAHFKDRHGRDYDEKKDFKLLYSDLVAEYQAEVAPIEAMRKKLRGAIATEYRNALQAHDTVDAWLDSMEKLSTAQKQTLDRFLGSLKSGLSTDDVEKAVDKAIANVKNRIGELIR